jgi:hypothetical protein
MTKRANTYEFLYIDTQDRSDSELKSKFQEIVQNEIDYGYELIDVVDNNYKILFVLASKSDSKREFRVTVKF